MNLRGNILLLDTQIKESANLLLAKKNKFVHINKAYKSILSIYWLGITILLFLGLLGLFLLLGIITNIIPNNNIGRNNIEELDIWSTYILK